MITRRTLTLSGLAAGLAAVSGRPARSVGRSGRPVVVELFTSQGCSSCPPADEYLGQLAARDEVIALAFHVDYWDYIGWKDPFADPAYTERQRGYGRALRNRTIYTPQMVIDGEVDQVGSRTWHVEREIQQRLAAGPADRFTVPVSLRRNDDGALEVSVPEAAVTGTADLFLAAYVDHRVTQVRRGENGGRTLEDFNVVRSFAHIGLYHGAALSVTVDRRRWAETADGLAVLLQADGHGPIWGCARIAV